MMKKIFVLLAVLVGASAYAMPAPEADVKAVVRSSQELRDKMIEKLATTFDKLTLSLGKVDTAKEENNQIRMLCSNQGGWSRSGTIIKVALTTIDQAEAAVTENLYFSTDGAPSNTKICE